LRSGVAFGPERLRGPKNRRGVRSRFHR
jgi:hypothetical protein